MATGSEPRTDPPVWSEPWIPASSLLEGIVSITVGAIPTASASAGARLRVATYRRASAEDPIAEEERRELRDYCERKDWEIVAEYLEESARRDSHRPRLRELLQAGRAMRFGVVVFLSLYDLTGSGAEDAIATIRALKAAGLDFVSVLDRYVNSLGSCGGAVLELLTAASKLKA